jgi:hypothetical protein
MAVLQRIFEALVISMEHQGFKGDLWKHIIPFFSNSLNALIVLDLSEIAACSTIFEEEYSPVHRRSASNNFFDIRIISGTCGTNRV